MVNKGTIKVDTQEHKENLKNARKVLKVLQQAASDKENLTGRSIIVKDPKLAAHIDDVKLKKLEDKAVQAGEGTITAADLVSDEPSTDYWKLLAMTRDEQLTDSLMDNERLKANVEALKEENRICKVMLDESKILVEVLQDMLGENEADTTELAEEATESTGHI